MRGRSEPFDLPNFSHGTAGVGYYLARLARLSGHLRFETAAFGAARYMISVADRREGLLLVPYSVPNTDFATPFDVGWAHGLPGTPQFFSAVRPLTGDIDLLKLVEASAHSDDAFGGLPDLTQVDREESP